MYEIKFNSRKQYLFSLILILILIVSALLKQRRLIQTKVHFKVCYYSVRTETTHKPSNVIAAKTFFSSVYVIDATCFDECFLFHVVTGRHYFWQKFVVTYRFFQPPYWCFLWNRFFERSPYFTYYTTLRANNGEVLVPKFQNKAIV